VYRTFFDALVDKFDLTDPNDLMMLDTACYDFLRMKRLQGLIMKQGDTVVVTSRSGMKYTKTNEASYLLNAVESQFRQTMKELQLTRKEQASKKLGLDAKDFSSFMSEATELEATEVIKDGDDKKVVRQIRGRVEPEAKGTGVLHKADSRGTSDGVSSRVVETTREDKKT